MKKLTILMLISCIGFSAKGQIINVPADYPTIQEGINAAGSWFDTVLVAPGTYYENISFIGKRITVASNFILSGDTMDIYNTIIDGSQPVNPDMASVVTFSSYEDTNSVICGFTITGGTGTYIPPVDVTGGGGINIAYSGAKIINNYIENNSANGNYGAGGGIACGPPGINDNFLVIKNNKIRFNKAIAIYSAQGGGINCGNAIIRNNLIEGNTCKEIQQDPDYRSYGGGIVVEGPEDLPFYIDISNNVITGNKSLSESPDNWGGAAGGVFLNNVYGNVKNNIITFNEISAINNSQGCGISCWNTDITLLFECNMIAYNYYSGDDDNCLGGGVHLYNATATFINNIIYQNHASKGGGFHFWDTEGTMGNSQLINNTIAFNEAEEDGGAIFSDNETPYVFNSILWENESSTGAEISGDCEVRFSCVDGEYPGEGNIDENPEFMDPDNDDFHIPEDSPCATRGMEVLNINNTWLYCPEFDFEGDPRPWHAFTMPDMGADEVYNPPPPGIHTYKTKEEINIQLYPNPCSSTTQLQFTYHISRFTSIDLHSIDGRNIRRLMEEEQMPGEHNIEINVSDLPAGVYFISMQAGDDVATKKLVVTH